MSRANDIETHHQSKAELKVWVDGEEVTAREGENILAVLFGLGKRTISQNDHGIYNGAFCGMGVCFCCNVHVDGQHKQRACKTIVRDGMQIQTCSNLYQSGGLQDG